MILVTVSMYVKTLTLDLIFIQEEKIKQKKKTVPYTYTLIFKIILKNFL